MLDIEPIKAREQAATKGPWYPMWGGEPNMVSAPRNGGRDLLAEFYGPSHDGRCPDADFAAQAREDIRNLIAEVERQAVEIEELREAILDYRR